MTKEHRDYNRKYYNEHKDEIQEQRRLKHLDSCKKYQKLNAEQLKEHHKTYLEVHKNELSEKCKIKNRNYKIKALETIAYNHGVSVECWRCGETQQWCLTIGHINQDGKEDRKKNGCSSVFHRKIILGIRNCDDLKIECMNCNCCLAWYGKYPDEMTEGEWKLLNIKNKISME